MPGPYPTYRLSVSAGQEEEAPCYESTEIAMSVAVLALWNPAASGKILKIADVRFVPRMASLSALQTPGVMLQWSRITSAPAGGALVAPVRMDSAQAGLPAGVEIRSFPEGLVAGTVIGRASFPGSTAVGPTGTTTFPLFDEGGSGGARNRGTDISGLFQHAASNVTGYVLQENQGLALDATAVTARFAGWPILTLYLKTSDGTYLVRLPITPPCACRCLSIWNPTGSGRAITVLRASLEDAGWNILPEYEFGKLDGINELDAATEDVLARVFSLDSANGALPAAIKVKRNCWVSVAGTRQGLAQTTGVRWFGRQARQLIPVTGAYSALMLSSAVYNRLPHAAGTLLRQGEGFGIFKRSGASLGLGEFEITFLSTNAAEDETEIARSKMTYFGV